MSLEDKRDDFYNETEQVDDEAVAHIKPNIGALKEESITEIKQRTGGFEERPL